MTDHRNEQAVWQVRYNEASDRVWRDCANEAEARFYHDQHGYEIRALYPRPADAYPEAVEVCAQAYQVVGSLLSDLGQFDTEHGRKILDNLSQHRLVHGDVLPWPSFARPADARVPEGRAEFERWMVEDVKCIVGSSDPYPAGMERMYWAAWKASRAALTTPPAPEQPKADTFDASEPWPGIDGVLVTAYMAGETGRALDIKWARAEIRSTMAAQPKPAGEAVDAEALAQSVIEELLHIPSHEAEPVAREIARRLSANGNTEDAARYRWLRENCKREWQSDMDHNRGAPSLDIDFAADGWDLDAAIDRARRLSGQEG